MSSTSYMPNMQKLHCRYCNTHHKK